MRMRSEEEMFDLILGVAKEREDVRAVYMNGSRTNPNAPRDIFQDYDIVYVVNDTKPFIRQKEWLSRFGTLVVMQEPDASVLSDDHRNVEEEYAYLMQFEDGNRIDLTVRTVDCALRDYRSSLLTLPLYDKDGILPELPPPTDKEYHVKCPSAAEYRDCCNEFWWVSPYIAKGLWRGEILYAMSTLDGYVRPMLLQMLSWHAGADYDFQVSTGKQYKYLDRYLPKELWEELLRTYPRADQEEMWESVGIMCALFDKAAEYVGGRLGYVYNREESRRTKEYLARVRENRIGTEE